MIDYTQLTDDELRRKVLELMGWTKKTYDTGFFLWFHPSFRGGTTAPPDPLENANVYMGLVDEMRTIGKTYGKAIRIIDCIGDSWFFVFGDLATTIHDMTSQSNNLGRAICEVYCQVKEQK